MNTFSRFSHNNNDKYKMLILMISDVNHTKSDDAFG